MNNQETTEELIERTQAMANGLRRSMWANRDEIIGLLDEAADRLALLKAAGDEMAEALQGAIELLDDCEIAQPGRWHFALTAWQNTGGKNG
jgi:hypothetical protein